MLNIICLFCLNKNKIYEKLHNDYNTLKSLFFFKLLIKISINQFDIIRII